MVASSDLCVVQIDDLDENSLLDTQRQITRELAAGRYVVAVCEDSVRRMEQITLASAAMKSGAGRFAIVAPHPEDFATLPTAIRKHFAVFSSQDEAVRWLQPETRSVRETLVYFELH